MRALVEVVLAGAKNPLGCLMLMGTCTALAAVGVTLAAWLWRFALATFEVIP